MSTTLEAELLDAATFAEMLADRLRLAGQDIGAKNVLVKGLVFRARAAWVREQAGYVERFGGFASGKMYESGWTAAINALTGPIPSKTAPAAPKEGTGKP